MDILDTLVTIAGMLQSAMGMDCSGVDWKAVAARATTILVEAKQFTTLCSMWDLMLAGEEVGKAQRKLDAENIKSIAKNNYPDVPQAMISLLDKWVQGTDVMTFVP